MAQTTLPVPQAAAPPRRRAFFGLFSADGWAWAFTKALFWFVVIILMLGYLPDRAYYVTVQKTVDLGLLAWSPVNLCPPENETLPCPAPGAATLPWHPAPGEIQLPSPRTDGSAAALGQTYLYVGGNDGSAATTDVYVAHPVGNGNLDGWKDGPALPEARADAASVVIGTTLYIIGGLDASGAPTQTVYSISVATDGALGEWKLEEAAALPEPRAGASAVAVSDGIVVMGGSDAAGPTTTVWKTKLSTRGAFGPWAAQSSLFEPNVDGVAVHVGDVIFLVGGSNATGPVATVQQGLVGGDEEHPAPADDPNAIFAAWMVSAQTNLPGPRTNLSGFTANGAIYLQGGNDGSGPRPETWWATPDADGVIPQWNHLEQTDLGAGIEGASAFTSGSHAFIVGGETAEGPITGAARANLAPMEPFFQAGLLGVVVPALKLDGEIGQQIGYLNAAAVGTVNFVLLLLIGWAYAHPATVRTWVARVRTRRE